MANCGPADVATSTPSYPHFLAARLQSQRKGSELRGNCFSRWKQDPPLGYASMCLEKAGGALLAPTPAV